jgi:spermidine synthase
MGMAAPFAIRLALADVEHAGSVAGRLYSLSTVGSLLGTFLSALVTIPLIGTQRTLLIAAALLALGGALLLRRRWLVVSLAVAALLAIPPGAIKATDGLIFETESRYQYVQVVERASGARYLHLNEGIAVHSVWRPTEVLTGGVWDTFLVLPSLLPRSPRRVAVLGNAGGTVARAFGRFYPGAEIDGVELDPMVSDVGRRYFGMSDNPRLRAVDADARPFLRSTDERYDLIFIDAYRPPYVPFYLATKEFFELARSRLTPTGLIALNVATVPGDYRLAHGIEATLKTVFSEVRYWQALRFNRIVVATDSTAPTSRAPLALAELQDLLDKGLRESDARGEPWTDDHSPVEWITDRMIVAYAAQGGRLDETPLPTRP